MAQPPSFVGDVVNKLLPVSVVFEGAAKIRSSRGQ
jgi:hypothetical protein